MEVTVQMSTCACYLQIGQSMHIEELQVLLKQKDQELKEFDELRQSIEVHPKKKRHSKMVLILHSQRRLRTHNH